MIGPSALHEDFNFVHLFVRRNSWGSGKTWKASAKWRQRFRFCATVRYSRPMDYKERPATTRSTEGGQVGYVLAVVNSRLQGTRVSIMWWDQQSAGIQQRSPCQQSFLLGLPQRLYRYLNTPVPVPGAKWSLTSLSTVGPPCRHPWLPQPSKPQEHPGSDLQGRRGVQVDTKPGARNDVVSFDAT